MTRRKFLKLAGGGVVLAAGGVGWYGLTRTPDDALKPWIDAGSEQYSDPRLNALSYAILAPNPHNRQPWIVSLEGEDEVILRFDLERKLPHTDPFDRQLTIGLGCFFELMIMAANRKNYQVKLFLFPDGFSDEKLDNRIIARAKFISDQETEADSLWKFVMDRRSSKEPFDVSRKVDQTSLNNILSSVKYGTQTGGTIAGDEVEFWRELTAEALKIEIETPRTYKESVDLFRIGKSEINENPDGIDFSGPLFEALGRLGMFTRETALDTGSSAYAQGIEAVLENCHSAMGHVWMVTEGNSRIDQIAAGRDWLRMNLACTRAGLGFQPMSQALQEYREVEHLYTRTHGKLAPDGGRVQMLSRIGYGPEIPVSPRWPLETRMVEI